MRLCTFRLGQDRLEVRRLGAVEGDSVFELEGSDGLLELLRSGTKAESAPRKKGVDLGEVRLLAPVLKPGKIVAAIVNTQGMLGGKDVELGWPRLDMKAPSTVIGPGESIRAPKAGVRPEVELAAVIGRKLTEASPEDAGEAIFGYTILNDVTAPMDSREDAYEAYRRDAKTGAIRRTSLRGPLFRSKNHDGFCPMGPSVVTSDEVGGTRSLAMRTRYDGVRVQNGSTAEYIFTPEQIASYVSGFLTLEPGDVISCGSVGWTPEALGGLDPTEFVLPHKPGVLELEIERLGVLKNPVVPE